MPDERSREELLVRLRALEDEARAIRESLLDDAPEEARDLVVLGIGTEQRFALDVHDVVEVTPWARCLPIPGAPAYVLGLLDLRGTLVPVVDAVARLCGASAQPTLSDSIVLARAFDRILGLRVVGIPEVRRVHAVRRAAAGTEVDVSPFVARVLRTEGEPLSMLDLRMLLAPEGLAAEPP